jgi:hypothetical protein
MYLQRMQFSLTEERVHERVDVLTPQPFDHLGGLGTATLLEAVGTTTSMKAEKMLDKMSAHRPWRLS